jgi:hypothetical protein
MIEAGFRKKPKSRAGRRSISGAAGGRTIARFP